jgi:hypothetical protein
MVAESNETMRRMFESFNDGIRVMMDAGQKSHDAWFRACNEAWRQPAAFDFDTVTHRGERFVNEFGPFVSKNFETFAQACDTGFRSGMEMLQTVCDAAARPDEGDYYKNSRRVWDKAFNTFRLNTEVAAKAGSKTFESCSAFMDSMYCTEPAGKTTPKTAKAGA